jgi:hypothetical protein
MSAATLRPISRFTTHITQKANKAHGTVNQIGRGRLPA